MILEDGVKSSLTEYFLVKSILARNFRCFPCLQVEFNLSGREIYRNGQKIEVGPLTLIVAKNGMGKSAILDAVRIAYGAFTLAFDYPSPISISKTDIRIMTDSDTNQSSFSLPVEIEAEGFLNFKNLLWRRTLAKETGRTTNAEAGCVSSFGKELKKKIKDESGDAVILPLIAYYGTARLWKEHRDTSHDKPLLKPRDYGYDYCLGNNSNYKAVYKWIKDALWAELTSQQFDLKKDNIILQQLQGIRNALEILLEEEGYSNFLHLNSYFKELAITRWDDPEKIWLEKTSLPVSILSDGVRAVFSMVLDIAFRCAKLNPQLGQDARNGTPGIVLIDEVDQHLHPAWQQKILNTLQIAFPKIQFIVTTHSPQVLSSVPKECVRIIDEGEVIPFDSQTQGVESQDILAQIFGTDPAPQEDPYVRQLKQYAEMEAHGLADSDEGRQLYRKLAEHFGERDAPLQRIEIHRKFIANKRGGENA